MGLIPHYTQKSGTPAVTGAGFGLLGCKCGESLLIAGYEPRNFLGIAIQCAACEHITETPGLAPGAPPPGTVTLLQRGLADPPATIGADTVLISREELDRLAALYMPRRTESDLHRISEALLDDVDFQQRRWTELPLDPDPAGYRTQPLAWAVAHFRERLRDPSWTTFANDTDGVAMTVIAAFRDLFGSWVNHPLFGAMVRGAAADGFSLHAMARFGAAKAMALSGNQISHVLTEGALAHVIGHQVMPPGDSPIALSVKRFDRFEWPDGGAATERAVHAAVLEAMEASRGHINRLHPGILVLSSGASDAAFDTHFTRAAIGAVTTHGKRHRGLAALAIILPKIAVTGQPGEVRFGYTFYPIPNRQDDAGKALAVGNRTDFGGRR